MPGRRGWITGDISSPVSNYVYRVVRLPNDQMLIGAFNGALAILGFPEMWEQETGLQTAEEAAEIMRDVLISMVDTGAIEPMITPRWMRIRFGSPTLNNLTQATLHPVNVDQYSHDELRAAIETDPMRLRIPEVGFHIISVQVATLNHSDLRGLNVFLYDPAIGFQIMTEEPGVYNPLGFNLQWFKHMTTPYYNTTPDHEIQLNVTCERSGGGQTNIDGSNTYVYIANFGETTFLTS